MINSKIIAQLEMNWTSSHLSPKHWPVKSLHAPVFHNRCAKEQIAEVDLYRGSTFRNQLKWSDENWKQLFSYIKDKISTGKRLLQLFV